MKFRDDYLTLLLQSYRKLSTDLQSKSIKWFVPGGIYLLKVNNRNSSTRCEYVQS